MRNTLNKIYDISRSNDWDLFVALTFNPEKVDSFDYAAVTKKLKNWIDNVLRKNNKDLKYIIVPERHISGRFHFHGLLSNCDNLKLIDSLKRDKKGRTIYNIDDYNLGWTTATKVGETDAVNKYIAKYVTKDLVDATRNKKRYWASRNCNRPTVEESFVDVDEVIKKLDNRGELLSKKVKEYTFTNEQGEDITSQIIYYELDSILARSNK